MLKNFVGSNTEVAGKISVSSQKDKAEKSHRLGKKRLNCVGNDKDQKLLLLRSQPVLLIFVPCVGECGFILHCLLLVERVVGDAVPGHCPLSPAKLFTLGSELPLRSSQLLASTIHSFPLVAGGKAKEKEDLPCR